MHTRVCACVRVSGQEGTWANAQVCLAHGRKILAHILTWRIVRRESAWPIGKIDTSARDIESSISSSRLDLLCWGFSDAADAKYRYDHTYIVMAYMVMAKTYRVMACTVVARSIGMSTHCAPLACDA